MHVNLLEKADFYKYLIPVPICMPRKPWSLPSPTLFFRPIGGIVRHEVTYDRENQLVKHVRDWPSCNDPMYVPA